MTRMQSQHKPPQWLLQLHPIPYKEAVKPQFKNDQTTVSESSTETADLL